MAIEFIEYNVSVDGKGSIEDASVFIYKRKVIAKADVFICGDFTLSEVEQIVAKMKELQEERKGLMMNAETND